MINDTMFINPSMLFYEEVTPQKEDYVGNFLIVNSYTLFLIVILTAKDKLKAKSSTGRKSFRKKKIWGWRQAIVKLT